MLLCMRTTIRIDDELLKGAKQLAAASGRTLTAVIEDALRMMLALRKDKGKRPKVRLETRGGRGVQPGVDLDDSASLLALMDSADSADSADGSG
jgi:hypothetical protein